MTLSLIALSVTAILFAILITLALLPFFPALASKLGAMPQQTPPLDFLKDPRGLSAAFRLEAKDRLLKGDYSPKDSLNSLDALYIQGNAFIAPKSNLRSLACDKSGVIGSEAKITEWIDAHDSLEFGERCALGSYATSHGKLLIGRGSTFKNLHGVPIHTAGISTPTASKPKQKSANDTSWFVGHLWIIIPQNAKVKEDMVSEKSVWVKEGAKIQGSLKSLQDIKLEDNVSIEGDLLAEGDIEVGPNCTILGNILAKGEVHLAKGVKIGAKDAQRSVSGIHTVKMDANVQIYGSVTTHGLGTVSSN